MVEVQSGDQSADDKYMKIMIDFMDHINAKLNAPGQPPHGFALFVFPMEKDETPRSIHNLTPESFQARMAKVMHHVFKSSDTKGSA